MTRLGLPLLSILLASGAGLSACSDTAERREVAEAPRSEPVAGPEPAASTPTEPTGFIGRPLLEDYAPPVAEGFLPPTVPVAGTFGITTDESDTVYGNHVFYKGVLEPGTVRIMADVGVQPGDESDKVFRVEGRSTRDETVRRDVFISPSGEVLQQADGLDTRVTPLGDGFYRVVIDVDVPAELAVRSNLRFYPRAGLNGRFNRAQSGDALLGNVSVTQSTR